ncbi:MAG: hypothetical protein ACI915_005183 [Gammaproteobacteria bacterium]|jgi:hypothetical protein
MPTTKIDKGEWASYFDGVSKTIGSKNVEIDIAGLLLGSHVEVTSLPLGGPKDDVFDATTESIGHVIKHPKEIYIDYAIEGLHSVEIRAADNNFQIIKFIDPVALPATKPWRNQRQTQRSR